MEDPFHWPVPGRHQTMALQTIGPRDVGLMQKGLYKGTDFSLTTHDIRGTD